MKKIFVVMLLCSTVVWAQTVLWGPVELDGGVYTTLTIHGAASLRNMTVGNLTVNGTLTADTVTAKKMSVHGSSSCHKVHAESLDVTGTLHIVQSVITEVSVLGDANIKGLKATSLSMFSPPSVPLYALRAEYVNIKAPEAVKLRVGDACYINTIHFVDAPGEVYVMKDRSYVGDISNGSLYR